MSTVTPNIDASELQTLAGVHGRVAWISTAQTWDALSSVLHTLAVGLMDEVFSVVGLCPDVVADRALPSPPMEVVRYTKSRWFPLRGKELDTLCQELSKRKVQVLHSLDLAAADLTSRISERLGVPFVVSCYLADEGRKLMRLHREPLGILAASQQLRDALSRQHFFRQELIHTVPLGVHQVTKATCFVDKDAKPALIVNAELNRLHEYEPILRAFADVHHQGIECMVFWVGSGPAEWKIRRRAHDLGLDEMVTFVEHRDGRQLMGICKSADLYLSPRKETGTQISSLLAMAAGVPVLSPDDAEAEFLVDGQTTLSFKAGKSCDIAEKLSYLLTDRVAAISLANHALEYLRQYHRPTQMVEALTMAYRKTILLPAESK